MPKSAFRYPGSKEKIAKNILRFFTDKVIGACFTGNFPCYCEPFIGCGAIAAKVLPLLPPSASVVLGDMDLGIVCLWQAIRSPSESQRLIHRILNYTPTVDDFFRFKEEDGKLDLHPTEIGFRKFVLHQMSFSGLGAKAGGPIGGKKQRSDYDVTCRFRPERHADDISEQCKILRRFKSFRVIHGDFEETLSHVPDDGFAYLDPPYYLQGAALYKHNMSPEDHARLAEVLRLARYEWVLSYDDHAEVKSLYGPWARIDSFEMTATIDTKRGESSRRKNNELVITPKDR